METFGELLLTHLGREQRTQAWLAERVGVNRGTVTKWVNGQARPGAGETVWRMVEALNMGDDAERVALFRAAGYLYTNPSHPPREVEGRASPRGRQPFAERFLHWAEAPADVRQSAAGLALYSLGSATAHLTPVRVRLGVGLVGIWLLAQLSFTPLLRWPLADPAARCVACLCFAGGLMLAPLCIALLAEPESARSDRAAIFAPQALAASVHGRAGGLLCFRRGDNLAVAPRARCGRRRNGGDGVAAGDRLGIHRGAAPACGSGADAAHV